MVASQAMDVSDITELTPLHTSPNLLFPLGKCLFQPALALVHRDAVPVLNQSRMLADACSFKLVCCCYSELQFQNTQSLFSVGPVFAQ